MKSTRMNQVKGAVNKSARKESEKNIDVNGNVMRRRGRSSSVADLHASRISAEFTKSRFMEVHDKKISDLLGYDEK